MIHILSQKVLLPYNSMKHSISTKKKEKNREFRENTILQIFRGNKFSRISRFLILKIFRGTYFSRNFANRVKFRELSPAKIWSRENLTSRKLRPLRQSVTKVNTFKAWTSHPAVWYKIFSNGKKYGKNMEKYVYIH